MLRRRSINRGRSGYKGKEDGGDEQKAEKKEASSGGGLDPEGAVAP